MILYRNFFLQFLSRISNEACGNFPFGADPWYLLIRSMKSIPPSLMLLLECTFSMVSSTDRLAGINSPRKNRRTLNIKTLNSYLAFHLLAVVPFSASGKWQIPNTSIGSRHEWQVRNKGSLSVHADIFGRGCRSSKYARNEECSRQAPTVRYHIPVRHSEEAFAGTIKFHFKSISAN